MAVLLTSFCFWLALFTVATGWPAQADVSDLRSEISSSHGRQGLRPTISSVDPCPASPDGSDIFLHLDFGDSDGGNSENTVHVLKADTDGSWQWVNDQIFNSWSPGHYNIVFTCGYMPTGSGDSWTSYASYAPLSYDVDPGPLPSVYFTPGTLLSAGKVTLTPSKPCPTGDTVAELSLWWESARPAWQAGGTGDEYKNVRTDSAGNWSASFDLSQFKNRIWPRDTVAFANCASRDQQGALVPYLEYGKARLTMDVGPLSYVALGDSYSSGEGNPKYDKGACDVSRDHAWPELMADGMKGDLKLVKNLACTGAKIEALDHEYNGKSPQLEALASYDAAVVTVTMGGNDVGFADILKDCFLPKHHCDSDGTIAKANAKVDQLATKMPGIYRNIQSVAGPNTGVYVVGYPQLFPSSQKNAVNCGWLTSDERDSLNKLATHLDKALSSAADQADVDYDSTLKTLKGHELCTKHSWVNKIQPSLNKSSGHPTKDGQQALADRVEHWVKPPANSQL